MTDRQVIFYYMKKKNAFVLGNTLRLLRKQCGLTQEELAKKIHCTQVSIAFYEQNKKKPSVDKIPLIAKALDVTINDLFGNAPSASAVKVKNPKLWKKFEQVETLSESDRRTISKMLDAFLAQKANGNK